MDIKKLLGSRIKELRKAKKYTQEKLAEIIGIEPASLSNLENGKYYPTADNLQKILTALGVSPQTLFKIEHHRSDEELIREINEILAANPNRLRDFYNILKALI